MTNGKSYIASLLLAVYAFSLALSASTGFTVAGLEVKKECPNKAKFKRSHHHASLLSLSLIGKSKSRGNQKDNSHPIQICNSSNAFIATVLEFDQPEVYQSAPNTGLPYLYQSPVLQKWIHPPRAV